MTTTPTPMTPMPVLPVRLSQLGASLRAIHPCVDRWTRLGQIGGERRELTVGPRGPGLLDPLVVLGEIEATLAVCGQQLLGNPFPIAIRGSQPIP